MHCALNAGRALRALGWAGLLLVLAPPVYAQRSEGTSSNVGYIDSAIPMTQFRFRFESAYDLTRSDRAEFIYSKGFDPRIDYQDFATLLEVAPTPRFSVFVELHEHLVNPELAPNNAGFGDMNAGAKFAFVSTPDRLMSLQLRTFAPTGLPKNSILGTGHVSVNPGLLYYQKLTDRLTFEGEVQDYIPIGGSDFAGNVIRYGAGLGWLVYDERRLRITPVAELLGWTVLSGKESTGPNPEDFQPAAGDTIVNAKVGVRVGVGERASFYAGYGRALTGDTWYKDVVRVEFRLRF